jgi:hypothetical protein
MKKKSKVVRGPIENHVGTIRVQVQAQLDIDGLWYALVPSVSAFCFGAKTRDEAIHKACEAASIPADKFKAKREK